MRTLKLKENRGHEASHMRAIISAWVIWAMIILGLVTSWAVQAPVVHFWPSLIGEAKPQDEDRSGSNTGAPVAPFATAAGPASGGAFIFRRADNS